MKLPTALEMQNLDRAASEDFGIPSIVLMENAGLGTVTMIERELGPCAGTFAIIFVGPGNNGGDGLVIGRHLHQRGCQPVFFFLVNPDTLKVGDIMTHNVFTINQDAPLETAATMMVSYRIGGMPVVDDKGRVVGVISVGDIVRAVMDDMRFTIRQLEGYIRSGG